MIATVTTTSVAIAEQRALDDVYKAGSGIPPAPGSSALAVRNSRMKVFPTRMLGHV